MTTGGGTADRNQSAQRRAASVERAAAANAAKLQLLQPGPTAVTTLETEDGATVTLSTEEIRRASGNTPVAASGTGQRDLGTGGSDDAPAGQGDGSGRDGGGREDGGGQQSNPKANANADTTSETATMDMTGSGGGDGAGTRRPPPPPPQPREAATAASGRGPTQAGAPQRPIIVREKAKTLKLKKIKGLDDTMPVTMWLKTEKQLYHEVASNLDGEAQRWFATVMESMPEDEENINTLAGMLRAKYMTQRTGPEVVNLLNARRQMRGERLVEYAQSLREIGERGDVGEDRLVNAFLKGMSSNEGATHVRGHRPQTLAEAVNLAVPDVGEYGEGYGVSLETAMTRWDERETPSGVGPSRGPRRELATRSSQGWRGTTGVWLLDTGPCGARRQSRLGTQISPAAGSKFRTASSDQVGARAKRPVVAGDPTAKRAAKTLKVEVNYGGGSPGAHGGSSNPAFATREARLMNQQRYLQQRGQPRREFTPRPGTECYYCGESGHFARYCELKAAGLNSSSVGANAITGETPTDEAGNGQRALAPYCSQATERERWRNGPVDDGKWPVEAEVEGEDGPENVEDDKYASGLGVAKGALSVAKKTERDVSLGMAPSDE
ncbi:hypothetical protein PR001_g10213 [Phytophthora rubi]|uniref:CCHC-type domain-containing protein n=1 Tax=Phytophthora rubi TaxID=129364 RepID=A0A6A3MZC8_9STRA|nr:hypothetical protein PR001_g10213 [Phytophthora rubi]